MPSVKFFCIIIELNRIYAVFTNGLQNIDDFSGVFAAKLLLSRPPPAPQQQTPRQPDRAGLIGGAVVRIFI